MDGSEEPTNISNGEEGTTPDVEGKSNKLTEDSTQDTPSAETTETETTAEANESVVSQNEGDEVPSDKSPDDSQKLTDMPSPGSVRVATPVEDSTDKVVEDNVEGNTTAPETETVASESAPTDPEPESAPAAPETESASVEPETTRTDSPKESVGADKAAPTAEAADATEKTGEDSASDNTTGLVLSDPRTVDDKVDSPSVKENDVAHQKEKSSATDDTSPVEEVTKQAVDVPGSDAPVNVTSNGTKTSTTKQPHPCLVCKKVIKCKYNIVGNGDIRHLCDDLCFKSFRATPTQFLRTEGQTKNANKPEDSSSGSWTPKMQLCTFCSKSFKTDQSSKFELRGGEIKPFCGNDCLKDFKAGKKVCGFCKSNVKGKKESLMASIYDGNGMAEFCNKDCHLKFVRKFTPEEEVVEPPKVPSPTPDVEIVEESRPRPKKANSTPPPPSSNASTTARKTQPAPAKPATVNSSREQLSPCSVCGQSAKVKHEIAFEGKTHKLCSDACFGAFRYANKLAANECCYCGSPCFSEGSNPHTIQFEGHAKKFCSITCVNAFKVGKTKIVPCTWCSAKKLNFDMIERVDANNTYQLFCSLNCLSLYRVNLQATSNQSVPCDQCRKLAPAQYHLTMSDASVRNFCDYACVMAFQGQFAKPQNQNPSQVRNEGTRGPTPMAQSKNTAAVTVNNTPTRQSSRQTTRKEAAEKDAVQGLETQSAGSQAQSTEEPDGTSSAKDNRLERSLSGIEQAQENQSLAKQNLHKSSEEGETGKVENKSSPAQNLADNADGREGVEIAQSGQGVEADKVCEGSSGKYDETSSEQLGEDGKPMTDGSGKDLVETNTSLENKPETLSDGSKTEAVESKTEESTENKTTSLAEGEQEKVEKEPSKSDQESIKTEDTKADVATAENQTHLSTEKGDSKSDSKGDGPVDAKVDIKSEPQDVASASSISSRDDESPFGDAPASTEDPPAYFPSAEPLETLLPRRRGRQSSKGSRSKSDVRASTSFDVYADDRDDPDFDPSDYLEDVQDIKPRARGRPKGTRQPVVSLKRLASVDSDSPDDDNGLRKSGRKRKPTFKVSAQDGGNLPMISNVMSLAGSAPAAPSPAGRGKGTANNVSNVGVGGQTANVGSQIIIQPPPPKAVRNKALQCKPFTQTKATTCRPHTTTQETQTDESSFEKKDQVIFPIPVPIYVPMPMAMYNAPQPYPVPIPIPIPVPFFIPTTKKSADSILRHIKEIQERMPADPFEAELLMMAEAVATAEKSDSSDDSDNDDRLPSEPNLVSTLPALSSTSEVGTGDMGEDMLSMALRMAEMREENALDLEDSITATAVAPQPPPTHDSSADTEFSTIDQDNDILSASRGTRSGWRGGKRRRGRGSTTSTPRAKRSRVEETPPEPEPPAPPPPSVPQPVLSDANMVLKYSFGVNAWKHWVLQKNEQLEKASSTRSGKLKLFKTDILQCTSDELNYSLCLFVKEVRKPNGDEYAPDSIYYLCLGIQQYLFENNRIDNIFTDFYCEKFTECLNGILQRYEVRLNTQGLIVCRIEEEHLWESKQLGAHSPHVLLNTLIYFNTRYFMLRTAEDHVRLSFSHIMKHWKKTNIPGTRTPGRSVYLRYYAPVNAKDNANKNKKREEVPVYEQGENVDNPLRCPVKLYEFYLSKCPESIRNRNDVFYLVPERSCVPDSPVWYSTASLGVEPMSKMLNRVRVVREIQERHLHHQPYVS